MSDVKKVIDGLEHEITRANIADLEWLDCVEVELLCDALALLKAQEPIEARLNLCESCAKEYAECEADKTDLVYGNGVGNDNIIGCPWYMNRWKAQQPETSDAPKSDSNVGCWYDITHNYTLEQVVSALKAQEAVEPKIIDTANSKLYHNDIFKNYYCGNCGEFLHVVNRKDLFCSQCGRAVKWE